MFAQGHDLRHSVRRRCRRRRLRGVAVKQDCRGGLLLRLLLNRITFSTLLRCKISNLYTLLSLESPELKAYIIYSSFLFCRQLNFHCRILFTIWHGNHQLLAKLLPSADRISFCSAPQKRLGKLERERNFCKSHFRLKRGE